MSMLYQDKRWHLVYEAEQRMQRSRIEQEKRGKRDEWDPREEKRWSSLLRSAPIGTALGCLNFSRPLCEKQAAPHSQVIRWLHCPLLTVMCKHTDTEPPVKTMNLRFKDHQTLSRKLWGLSAYPASRLLISPNSESAVPVHFSFFPGIQRIGSVPFPQAIHSLSYRCNRDPIFPVSLVCAKTKPKGHISFWNFITSHHGEIGGSGRVGDRREWRGKQNSKNFNHITKNEVTCPRSQSQ